MHEDNKKNLKKLSINEMLRIDKEQYIDSIKTPIVLVCDNIRSMNNVGSIFRTADSFRLSKILLCGITSVPPHNDIHKTALGAEDAVPWEYYSNTLEALGKLKEEGYYLLALEQCHGSIMLDNFDVDSNKKYALVLGNEVFGVSNDVVSFVDDCIEIPQKGTKHSLNVSVATGIAVWHIARCFLSLID